MSQVQKAAHEFDTLTDLNSYVTAPVYSDITSNQAEQFFGLAGQLETLEANVLNATVVTLIPNLPTTVGAVIRTILATMAKSSGSFTIDPSKTAGQLNIAAANILVSEGILVQPVVDAFFSIGIKTSMPYFEWDQSMLDAAKADEALKNPIGAHSYTVQGFEVNAVNAAIVKTGRDLIVDVIFDAPVTKDCIVSVTALLLDTATGEYVPETVSDSVRVSTGSISKNYRIKRNFSARKMKFEATCNYGFPFQVKVAEA